MSSTTAQMQGLTSPTPLGSADVLISRISELQEKLQAVAPGYEHLLHTIHTMLHKDPDMVHMLSEEQIGVIVSGLSRRKNIVIAEPEKAGKRTKTASGKSIKDLDLDDLV
jgi:hypothetical protein